MTKTTDVAIIGFGKAGKTLAVKLAAAGKSVILMEENPKRYGGTSINVACIPTKTLTEKALLSHKISGSWATRKALYTAAVSAKDKFIALLRDKNYHKLADKPAIKVIDGHASFIDNTHLKMKQTLPNGVWSS
jgi:pyruvate/2-oxoglutarate dehydrogenase complex dihydrolipoamide dehydrogenase (E3) component